ncbi:MAG: LPS export ABC transporter periplasmic protein LptC [Syntrophales bacterium]|jgi:LPS export ABC transporter protein LptC
MKKPVLVTVALILVAVVAVLIFLWEQGKEAGKKILKVLPDHVDMQVNDVLYTDVSADGSKWEIRAKTVTFVRKENLALFDQVVAKVIQSDGRTFIMTGKNGRFWTATKDLDVTGDVVIISDKGDRITMDVLRYSERDKILSTDSDVTLDNDTTRLKGKGMRIDINKRHVLIMSHVNAIIKAKK